MADMYGLYFHMILRVAMIAYFDIGEKVTFFVVCCRIFSGSDGGVDHGDGVD